MSKVIKMNNSVDYPEDKIASIGSAIMIAQALLKQSTSDRGVYEEAFTKKLESIPDQRAKAIHKIPFNMDMIAYAETAKALEKQISELKEELDDEMHKHKIPSSGEAPDSKA